MRGLAALGDDVSGLHPLRVQQPHDVGDQETPADPGRSPTRRAAEGYIPLSSEPANARVTRSLAIPGATAP